MTISSITTEEKEKEKLCDFVDLFYDNKEMGLAWAMREFEKLGYKYDKHKGRKL